MAGVDISVHQGLLQGWGSDVQFVRIPEEEIEIDFRNPVLPPQNRAASIPMAEERSCDSRLRGRGCRRG
jgi:hypothetical protein